MSLRTFFSSIPLRINVASTSTCTCTHFHSNAQQAFTNPSLTVRGASAEGRPATKSSHRMKTPPSATASSTSKSQRQLGRFSKQERVKEEVIPDSVTLETLSNDLHDKLDVRLIAHLARPPTDSERRAYLPVFLARERKRREVSTSEDRSKLVSSESDGSRHPLNAPEWLRHRDTIKKSFPEGWNPPKKLSREAISLLRLLHQSNPSLYPTPALAERFKISPEAVRRILKGRWEISAEEGEKRDRKRKEKREEERRLNNEKPWAGDVNSERGEIQRLRQGVAERRPQK